jgi:hypothetical protein
MVCGILNPNQPMSSIKTKEEILDKILNGATDSMISRTDIYAAMDEYAAQFSRQVGMRWVKFEEETPNSNVNANYRVRHKDGSESKEYWNGVGFINFNTFSWNYFTDIQEWLSEDHSLPLQPEVSEDELWYKAIDLIMTAHDRGLSKEEAVSIVSSSFSISERSIINTQKPQQ